MEELTLDIRPGPLPEADYQRIHSEYNRLGQNDIPFDNFRRWMCQSPAGPALHAMLRRHDGLILGHMALFPFPFSLYGKAVTAAKGEYLFLHEDFRRGTVRGCANVPPALLMLRELYAQNRRQQQWDPVFLSAPPGVNTLHAAAGAKSVSFDLRECLSILRPLRAAGNTPNLTARNRAIMLAVGSVQRLFASARRTLILRRWEEDLVEQEIGAPAGAPPADEACFSRDSAYLRWRYPADQFVRYAPRDQADQYVICRRGSPTSYLRVCSASFTGDERRFTPLLAGLIGQAIRQRALGVRWAVYDHGNISQALLPVFKKMFFIRAPRQRQLQLDTRHEALLDPAAWQMEDSIVSFEH